MDKNIKRGILIPVIAIIIMGVNLSFIDGSECLRVIHIVSLLVMGVALGVLLMNSITLYRNSKK